MNAVASCGAGSLLAAPAVAGPQRRNRLAVRAVLFLLLLSFLVPLPAEAVAGTPSQVAVSPQIEAWSCSGSYHTVQRGESIYSIARRYGTTASRIAVCNGLSSYTVYVGQSLLVPTARKRASEPGSLTWPVLP